MIAGLLGGSRHGDRVRGERPTTTALDQLTTVAMDRLQYSAHETRALADIEPRGRR